jgi:hypothetical protein
MIKDFTLRRNVLKLFFSETIEPFDKKIAEMCLGWSFTKYTYFFVSIIKSRWPPSKQSWIYDL